MREDSELNRENRAQDAELESREIEAPRPKRRLNLDKGLIPAAGRRIALTNEEINELIDLT